MSTQYIPLEIRQSVAEAAKYRCGYCLTSQEIIGPYLQIDHILPESRGGTADEENLWLACPLCNNAKSDHVEAEDPETDMRVPLFNPRREAWTDHFRWSEDGTEILGRTPVGRATIARLKMNDRVRVAVRAKWVAVGWHPPADL